VADTTLLMASFDEEQSPIDRSMLRFIWSSTTIRDLKDHPDCIFLYWKSIDAHWMSSLLYRGHIIPPKAILIICDPSWLWKSMTERFSIGDSTSQLQEMQVL
jgi:hypothetical protein